MGFFGRLSTLIRSNLNDLISRSEDPAKMLNQIILDMNAQLVEAKKQVAVAIAGEKKLKRQWDSEKALVEEWHKKAAMAVRAGDDSLAREALARKKEHEALAKGYEAQWSKHNAAVEKVKGQLQALSKRIKQAEGRRQVLLAQHDVNQALGTITQTMSNMNDTSAFEAFDRMQNRIEQASAENEARIALDDQMSGDALEQRFAELEQGKALDAELEALKAEQNVTPPAAVTQQAARVEVADEEVEDELKLLKQQQAKA